MPTYKTTVTWKGGHLGGIVCGNGSQMDFSAPADLYGKSGVLTPEDAFVGSLNMCYQLMFLWSVERLKLDLVSYECEAEGVVEEFLDRTSTFSKVVLRPKVTIRGSGKEQVARALKLAEKYSLVAQSIKAEVVIDPEIRMIEK